LLALMVGACTAGKRQLEMSALSAPDLAWEGPRQTALDLLRIEPGGSRIYVQATLPDGERDLFLVDTGADVNVLDRAVAERLGVPVTEGVYRLGGLGGSTTAGEATLSEVRLGEAVLRDVPFAVGVRGVSDTAGLMPLSGILGMEVWKRFVLEIDYPADRLVLHRPGQVRLPRRAAPLHFDGNRIEVALDVTTGIGAASGAAGQPVREIVIVQLDTGAGGLILSGASGLPFAQVASEGLEPIYGIGASELMPPSQFLRRTRRIPVDRVGLGGAEYPLDLQAQWLNYDDVSRSHDLSTRGLAGHLLMQGHRVWLDPQGGRIALTGSPRRKRQMDGHAVMLEQDLERFGAEAPERDLFRARMLAATGEWEQAKELLTRWVTSHPDDAEGRVLLARARRLDGDPEGAWQTLEPLGPDGLVDESEIVAAVNGLALDGRTEPALALAHRAVQARPDEAEARLALADAQIAAGQLQMARETLLRAAELLENPDAFLMHRARVAMQEGDRYGALALVRRLVTLYPTEGKFLWYYALMVQDASEAATLRADAANATGQLHPDLQPLDFLVATHHALGDTEKAEAYLDQGLSRDCEPMKRAKAAHDNCTAWYLSLAGRDLDRALSLVDGALEKSGPRADYLDTKAVVHLARGEWEAAERAAKDAARLQPDDVYMIWQAERIGALRADQQGKRVTTAAEAAPGRDVD
jgi:tetratricopeptide (TPR) repeat protein